MWAVAPHTVSSSSSKKCSGRSSGGAPQRSTWYTPGAVSSRRGVHSTRSTSIVCAREFGPVLERGDDRHDVAAADDGVQVRQLADHPRRGGVQPDLLVRFAQRGLDRCLTLVDPTAGKAHLAPMVAHRHGPPGQQDLGTVDTVDEDEQHRGEARAGKGGEHRRGIERDARHAARRATSRSRGGQGATSEDVNTAGRGICCDPPRRTRRVVWHRVGHRRAWSVRRPDRLGPNRHGRAVRAPARGRRSSCWPAPGPASGRRAPTLRGQR